MSKGSYHFRFWPARLLIVLSVFLGGCVHDRVAPPMATGSELQGAENLRTFDRVWGIISVRYYDGRFHGVDWRECGRRFRPAAEKAKSAAELYETINDMLAQLKDAHTSVLTPAQVREVRKRQGVLLGLVLGRVDGAASETVVVDVLEGSPAAAAGVRPGWILTAVDGRSASEMMNGGRLQAGQTALCDFLDERDQPRRLALTARRLSVAPARVSDVLPGGVLYLRMDEFEGGSIRWLRRQLTDYRGVPALVLDLRSNLGGEVTALEECLGEFFSTPVHLGTFIERGGRGERDQSMRRWGTTGFDGSLVVLVSRDTASCAEILAEVIQHYRRGVVIGAKTRGSVLGSDIVELPGGGELQYSVFDYLSPRGRRLEGAGVAPDVETVLTLQDLRKGRDPSVEEALRRLSTTLQSPPLRTGNRHANAASWQSLP